MTLILTLDSLIRILNVAKALKTTEIIWYGDYIFDANANQHIAYTTGPIINPNERSPMRPIAINVRELSTFVKTSSVFNQVLTFDSFGVFNFQFRNEADKVLSLHLSNYIDRTVAHQMDTDGWLGQLMNKWPMVDVSDQFQELYKATKTIGAVRCDYDGYIMYLSSNIIPLTKTDRLYITILPMPEANTFTVRFIIKKKSGQQVCVYLSFLKI